MNTHQLKTDNSKFKIKQKLNHFSHRSSFSGIGSVKFVEIFRVGVLAILFILQKNLSN